MQKYLPLIAVLLLTSCSVKKSEEAKEEQMIIPTGMSIRSQFTTRMDVNDLPVDDVTYIPPTMENITVYTSFDGITQGSHDYQWTIRHAEGETLCPAPQSPAENYFSFESGGGTQNVWSRISIQKCLPIPGDYELKIYLDGNLVLRKGLKVLSDEEMNSGKFEAYWNKDKYKEIFPAAKTKLKGDWMIHNWATDEGRLMNLYVAPYKGFNRVFAIYEADRNYTLKESTNYGWHDVHTFDRGELDEPWFIRYQVVGDELYFYNSVLKNSYNLISGQVQHNVNLPFQVAADNGFISPSGKYTVSRIGMLNGKLLVADGTCPGGVDVHTVSWSEDEKRVFYNISCRNMETLSGLYQRDLISGQTQRLMEEFEWLSSPVYFNNNGTDFFAYVQDEEGQPAKINVATQVQFYSELGFGPNFSWDGSWTLPIEVRDQNGAYLPVNFLPEPKEYLSYEFSNDYNMEYKHGSIRQIGTIREGPLAGDALYAVHDYVGGEGDKGPGPLYNTTEDLYLIRHGEDLIIINLPEADRESLTFPDLDGKRKKSSLFNGATKLIHYKNQFITALLSAPQLDIPNSTVKLKREGIVKGVENKGRLRKIFDHPVEGEIYVQQSDDGSFWRLNGDKSATLYSYVLDFGVVIDANYMDLGNNNLNMEEYVPFTNQGCQGDKLDFAHIITPDPTRLKVIGTTSKEEPVFGFVSEQDELVKQEYNQLKAAYDEYNSEFKSFESFMKSLPLFLWKDPFGRYVRFVRREYLRPTNCEPILYLYPETTTDVSVDLGNKINVIASQPRLETQWNVRAEKDGKFIDLSTTKQYDRIFWEGISDHLPPLEKGFVIDTAHLSSFFDQKLLLLGLNEKEKEDFKKAWLKEFDEAPYYFIGFYESWVIDKYAPMNIKPQPETVIRILMDYRPLPTFQKVEEPQLQVMKERKGFTAVEWAGLKR